MSDPKRKYYNPRWKKNKKKKDNDNEKGSANDEEENRGTNDDQCSSDNPTPSSSGQPKRRIVKKETPYPSWDMYFYDEEYKKMSPTVAKIKTMEMFLDENPQYIVQNDFESTLRIDVSILYNSTIFLENWNDFKSELKSRPEYVLACLGLASHKVRASHLEEKNEIIDVESLSKIKVRLLNFEPVVSLKNLKVNYYGKFVSVRGCTIRVNRPCHMAAVLVLLCQRCKYPHSVCQKNGIYTLKKKCDSCGAMKFEPDLGSPFAETIPLQIIRIQEHFGEEPDDQGRVPRVMDVELHDDLVDTCMPGDDVTITGIIKMQGTDNGKVKASAVSTLYIEANTVLNNNNKSKNDGGSFIDFSHRDYKLIRDIHERSDILCLLVHSLCPGIYGHEMIKMALLLSLVGGSSKHANLRDNIHVLVVGDPGLGKSQMLQACSRVAPKGIYVSGNSSSSSGLTVTLVRESGQNDFALEPGALVLADRGCCCIDEFDKMPTQHQALLEAMEQQCVSVAKSGVIWSLPARTSILAAANPIGGRYDKSKLLSRNLNMSQPLLSRFDLIFLLLDQPDKDLDNFLSGHVMQMHTGKEGAKDEDLINYNRQATNQMNSLRKRLIVSSRNPGGIIQTSLLRKYIAYVRQYVKPTLSPASAAVLQKFYLNLRKKNDSAATLSPCNRQLEALIRLTEARAKLDLREETTEKDALDIIELVQYSVLGMNTENTEYTFLQTSTSRGSRGGIKTFLKMLMEDVGIKKNDLYTKEELKNLALKGKINESDIMSSIDKLNEQGFLIKRANDLYKFIPP